MRKSIWFNRSIGSVFATCSAALLLGAIIHAAWLCDDAFITLRSVDNWVHGYGLRWNVTERVQSFTHPAWLFLVAAAYAPSKSPGLALFLPAIVATTAFIVAFNRMATDRYLAGAMCLMLLGSKAFVEYSTSGLENPLVHVLLVGYLLATESTLRLGTRLWIVVLSAALLLLTRMDLVWLIGPSLLGAAWRARRELTLVRTWLGLAPLAGWELFSLLYYGFPFPNTAYAKLNTGVPVTEAIEQGLIYLRATLRYDPVTILAIALASVCGLMSRRLRTVLLALGLITWQAYLVRIGGDFMVGRLLTPALVVAAAVFLETIPTNRTRWVPWAAAAVVLITASLPRTALFGAPRQVDEGWLPEGVTDERAIFYTTTGLFRTTNPEGPRSHSYARVVLTAVARGQRVIPARSIGFAGYFAGPNVHLVDEFGLADPLLARLPADPAWSAGHFSRRLPDGYLATLETGENQLTEPTLALRYSELARIVHGEIFSAARLRTIVRWNLDQNAIYPLDYQVRHVTLADVLRGPADGGSVRRKNVLVTDRQGLAVLFAEPTLVRGSTIHVGGDDRYRVTFRRGKTALWQTQLTPALPNRNQLTSYSVSLPEPLWIDSLLIQGRRGDKRFHVGRVAFDEAVQP
jgi:arabinofuranosyltransferase